MQLGLAGGLPLLDAAVEHPDTPVSHVEDASGGDCPASHGHHCDICQLLAGARALPLPAGHPSVVDVERRQPAPQSQHLVASAVFLDGHSSRAPPLG